MNEREIFIAALQREVPSDRAAFLDSACADNASLRARVTALLEEHDRLDSFLETPAAGAAPTLSEDRTDTETQLDFLVPSDDPRSLGRLGNYEIARVIGRGGMGVVLEGRDTRLNRVVAIKVLAPELAGNAAARKRFLREARSAAAVVHQHVVTIHAVDEDRLPYLVMEFIDGQSLQDKIDREGHLELKEVLRIGVQVASGLAAAHAHGVIHRDIKPANILLENGVERVRITDFGLARAVDDVEITRTGEVAGTPQYMSPEQAQGLPVDARSDLFSLGCVLYAMCTGRSPFRAESLVAAIRRVCDDTPRPIREVNPDVPEWLVEIIDRLLAKRPEDRYQTAREVAELLGQHLAGVQQPPVPLPGRPSDLPHKPGFSKKPGLSRPRLATALVLLALLAGLGVTEATGVTHFVAAILRISTAEGTLIVEVDDPAVSVTVEGDGGVVITGAGPQEVRLPPGRYQLRATKEGQPVREELVTITRGDRRVVRVAREGAAATAARVQPHPFVILARDGNMERAFGTLAEAVLAASDGDTIEIRAGGPFPSGPVEINQALTIRAGAGRLPCIKLTADRSEVHSGRALLHANAPLVLEGLELQADESTDPENADRLVTCAKEVRFFAVNCRFQPNAKFVGCFSFGPECAVTCRNCVFVAPTRPCTVLYSPRSASLRIEIDNCVAVGSFVFFRLEHMRSQPTWVSIRRSTVAGFDAGVNLPVEPSSVDADLAANTDGQDPKAIQFEATGNVFATKDLVWVQPWTGFMKPAPIPTTIRQVELLRWQGERNLYSLRHAYFAEPLADVFGPAARKCKSLDDWRQFWPSPETASLEGPARFHGGDLLSRASLAPDRVTADDFRLLEGSAWLPRGHRWQGPGGRHRSGRPRRGLRALEEDAGVSGVAERDGSTPAPVAAA